VCVHKEGNSPLSDLFGRLLGITRKIPTALPTTQPLENYWHIKSFRSAIQGVKNDFASFDFRMPHRPLPCHREHRCTAAIAPVSALCPTKQTPQGPQRRLKRPQEPKEVQRPMQATAAPLRVFRKSSPTKCFLEQLVIGPPPHA